MRPILFAVTLAISALPAWADTLNVTSPQEVGSTTMPPGQYYVTEQLSHKSYSLMVTSKGNMILGPAPQGLEVRESAAGVVPAAVAAPVAAVTAVGAAVVPGAVAPVTAAAAVPATALPGAVPVSMQSKVKGLVEQEAGKQMEQFLMKGAGKELGGLLK